MFEPEPYVTYTISWMDMPPEARNLFLGSILSCLYYDEIGGTKYVVNEGLFAYFYQLPSPSANSVEFYISENALCEFEVAGGSAWSFTLSRK